MGAKDAFIRPPYNLDPFIPLNDELADRLYGRVTDLANAHRPSPWVLLMRNMYGVLVGEAKKQGHPAGSRRPKNPEEIKPLGNANIRNWAMAFNIAVKTQHEDAGYFKRPKNIDKTKDISLWEPPLQLNFGSASPGKPPLVERWRELTTGNSRHITAKILRIMEEFRLNVAKQIKDDPDYAVTE